jgi:Protein of unknown function (DUF3617)
MFMRRVLLLCAAVTTTVLLPVHADQQQAQIPQHGPSAVTPSRVQMHLNADLGLWEITTRPQLSGDTAALTERLNSLPPEQQARMKAAMQSIMANQMKEHVFRECMTPEQQAKGFETGDNGSNACTTTLTSNTATDFVMHKQCTSNDRQWTEDAQVHLAGGKQASGVLDVVQARGDKSFTTHMTYEAKWVSADCGGIKFQRVR